jgi:Mn2+/Fe2+ NRAMP family transporter
MHRRWRRIGLYFAAMGPGIITANIDNDAAGIATYSVAGAHYGYSLLWTLIPTTVALLVIQEMVARMGVITGKGLADLIRENYGVKVAVYMMLGLFVANFGTTVAEFAGWAAAWEVFGVSRYVTVPIGAFMVWVLVTRGSYRGVERVLLVACVLYLGYIVSGFMSNPDWAEVARGTLLPELRADAGFLTLGIAIIGTTITPWMQFYLQSSIAEKGTPRHHYRLVRLDVFTGCLLTDVVAFFIIVACAATLYPAGVAITDASDAAMALEPLAGKYASLMFGLSLANASLLGAIIVPLATAYYICEAMGWERGVSKSFQTAPQFMWIYTAMIVFGSAIILVPGAPLVTLMVLSSVVNGLLLPFVLLFALSLVNNGKLMGEHVNSRAYNYISWATVLSIIALTAAVVAVTLMEPAA